MQFTLSIEIDVFVCLPFVFKLYSSSVYIVFLCPCCCSMRGKRKAAGAALQATPVWLTSLRASPVTSPRYYDSFSLYQPPVEPNTGAWATKYNSRSEVPSSHLRHLPNVCNSCNRTNATDSAPDRKPRSFSNRPYRRNHPLRTIDRSPQPNRPENQNSALKYAPK